MNWIGDMNDVLKYIEENICNEISTDDICKIAHMSKFHFLRIFNILTGITLGEYIRQRRLSLAVKDVVSSELKIIDIAYKYGYETPEAFTKAFKKLHKISPSEARKNKKNLKAIPPLSFQIIVKGEERMNYKIESKEAFKVAGVSRKITTKNGENFKIIPKFWNEVCESGQYDILEKSQGKLGVIGMCYDFKMEAEEFKYMIAVEGTKVEGLEACTEVQIPALTWAIFESVGPMPTAIQEVTKKIFSEWFPATKYEHADGPELEVYLPGNPNAEDYRAEVWIPVVEK
ncbi:AraC family transcriptional regulator [Clostridium hydrogenum]|uniref:AraC family transcriptional regulator n=1 Tax=Clostridium hydrogenum TaxID=2855764 RepID=UPI001F3E546F|nr:AraC family transcriptional regulator [Clostridium hydrogenum]